MVVENKRSFFSLIIVLNSKINNDYYINKLQDSIDVVLGTLGVSDRSFHFKSSTEFIYYFQTEKRKRKGHSVRYTYHYT